MTDQTTTDPLDQFLAWFEEAKATEPTLPEAMSLATVDAQGRPSSRMLLLKGADEVGFVFYTNLESRKGEELAANNQGALLFHWKSLGRQVRIEGSVEPVSGEEADAYFATRDRGAQIGAWASAQSRVTEDRFALEKSVAKYTAKFGVGKIARPPFWSGYRLVPDRFEFWTHGMFRLHDRLVYRRDGEGWVTEKLYP